MCLKCFTPACTASLISSSSSNIHLHRQDFPAQLLDALDQRMPAGDIPETKDNVRPGLSQRQRARPANAFGGSSNQSDLAFQGE